jgi:hypothetical protein
VAAPRWYEPRFEGEIVREGLPPGFFDELAARLRAAGLQIVVTEKWDDAQVSYRTSGAPPRSIQVASPGTALGVAVSSGTDRSFLPMPLFESDWDRLLIWQDGPHTLRYEGSFRRSAGSRFGTWLVVVGAYACALSLCCPASIGIVFGMALLAAFVEVLARHRRRARRGVEAFVEHQLERAEPLRRGPIPATAPVGKRPVGAYPVRTLEPPREWRREFGPQREPVRTFEPPREWRREFGPQREPEPAHRVHDPVLARTARTAREEIAHHGDAAGSPEEQVEKLEEAARRGIKE